MRRPRPLLLPALLAALLGLPAASQAHGGADHGERVVDGALVEVPLGTAAAPTGALGRAGGQTWRGTGPRPLAIVQVLLPGRDVAPYPELSEAALRSAFVTAPDSASRALQEMTDGVLSLTGRSRPDGDVLPAVTVSASGGCRWQQWAAEAKTKLAGLGHSLTPYLGAGNVAYVLRGPTGCDWSGLAYMPGTEIWLANSISRSLIVHELGHNLGLDHAASARCRTPQGAAVFLSGSCSLDEYGDPFDPMGSGSGHYAAPHKAEGGWLPASAVRTVSATGTYDLGLAADPAAATRMLRIPRPDGRELTAELRRPYGSFDRLGTGGVFLRLQDPGGSDERTLLLDATPSTSSFADAALAAGRTVVDEVAGIAVRVDAAGSATAKVSVSLEGAGGLPALGGLLDDLLDLVTPDPPAPVATPPATPDPPPPPALTTTPPPAGTADPVLDEGLEDEGDDGDTDEEAEDEASEDEEARPAPWRRPSSLRVDGRRRSVATLSRSRALRGRTITASFRSPVRELRVRTAGCRTRITVRGARTWLALPRSGRARRQVRDVRIRCASGRGRVALRSLTGR